MIERFRGWGNGDILRKKAENPPKQKHLERLDRRPGTLTLIEKLREKCQKCLILGEQKKKVAQRLYNLVVSRLINTTILDENAASLKWQ